MFNSIRSKLIVSLLGVTLFVGAVSLFAGVYMLKKHVIGEAGNRVRQDLNAASEMYRTRAGFIRTALSITSLGSGFIHAVSREDTADLAFRLNRMGHHAGLDFAGIVTENGRILCRIGSNAMAQSTAALENPIARLALERQAPVEGNVVLTREMLVQEDPELAERARITLRTEGAGDEAAVDETRGLAMAAAVPIFNGNSVVAVLYGGQLLNRAEAIVDAVRDTIFRGEVYKGRTVGTATIFLGDIRISTNVLAPDGKRALGTRVSPDVKDAVLNQGLRWTGRAYVVSDWYISAYEAIEDIAGHRVGMLYVGALEEKYTDVQKNALTVFFLITAIGMLLAVGFGFLLADRIMDPVNRLIKASREVSEGSLQPDIGPILNGEFGVLQNTFKEMVAAMGRRRAASENKIMQSERQASIGRLAAGVAHEINNPLTGVLTYTHMLLRRKDLDPEVRADLETVAAATDRVRKIVKGLLDFSRQTKLDPEPTEINRLVSNTIALLENQALVKGVAVKFTPGENLPLVTLDRSQMQSVLMNLIINALDATAPGGSIKIYTAAGLSGAGAAQKGVELTVADTGTGIHPDHMDKLFDPFFTTKAVGQGTGLGLSVSQGIVQRHGGHIRVQSELGKGTRFFVWLPVDKKGALP
ncbi:MAG: HAMP domain-containing protein [Desulfobacteraceae bacterium]|nr:MAG: HAMP domain-containing protein [Desulfobacteraceae bacterium]